MEGVNGNGLKETEGRYVRLYGRDLDTFTRVRLQISEEKFSKTSIIACLFLHSERRHQLAVLTSDKYIMVFDWGTGTNSLNVLSEEPKFKLSSGYMYVDACLTWLDCVELPTHSLNMD